MDDDQAPPEEPTETAEQLFARLSGDARERLLNALARYLLEEEQRRETLRRLRNLS